MDEQRVFTTGTMPRATPPENRAKLDEMERRAARQHIYVEIVGHRGDGAVQYRVPGSEVKISFSPQRLQEMHQGGRVDAEGFSWGIDKAGLYASPLPDIAVDLTGPISGYGCVPEHGGFTHIRIGERSFTEAEVRRALTGRADIAELGSDQEHFELMQCLVSGLRSHFHNQSRSQCDAIGEYLLKAYFLGSGEPISKVLERWKTDNQPSLRVVTTADVGERLRNTEAEVRALLRSAAAKGDEPDLLIDEWRLEREKREAAEQALTASRAQVDALAGALEHAKRWITETCDNAHREGTSVDTLASGRKAALKPINRALAAHRPGSAKGGE